MALTIQDSGVPQISLHGPKGIADIFDAVKRFACLANLTVNEANCSEETIFEDSCMTIRYVSLTKDTSDTDSDSEETLVEDDTDYYAHEVNKNGKRWAKQMKLKLKHVEKMPRVEKPSLKRVSGCIAYICKLTAKSGRLNLEKCVEKGVTPGPILGELKAGRDVTLPDGSVIKSVEVCDPDIPGPVFIGKRGCLYFRYFDINFRCIYGDAYY